MSRLLKINYIAILFVVCISAEVFASVETNSAVGINSVGVPYTGKGISIGQVEFERPGKFGFDNVSNSNFGTIPKEVFLLDDRISPTANSFVEIFDPTPPNIAHANQVAGVMISKDPFAPGVARDADLYATAGTFATVPSIPTFDSLAISTQFIATRDNDDVRAINLSFLVPFEPNESGDGNSKYTQFIDWSAVEHDVLYVAGNIDFTTPTSFGQPLDNFNGMTVAASEKADGVYRKFAAVNGFSTAGVGDRTFIDILAPGHDVKLAEVGGNPNLPASQGTSYAVPHVTGTVALLQEYGDERIAAFAANPANAPNWGGMVTTGPAPGPTARRHEVMKAVLMNSADKLNDNNTVMHNGSLIPQGKLLGMERTVVKQNGTSTWFDSDAFMFDGFNDIPLDEEMGAGHLNAKRALQQFLPGEQEVSGHFGATPVNDVPVIGWDYGTIAGPNFPINKYLLDEPLTAGNFISVTLAWDREVEFANDIDMDGEFDINDTFEEYTNLDDVLTNLDLYLVPKGTVDIEIDDQGVSNSSVTSVEHIFTEIPFDGEFEIWVFRNEQSAPPQDYGLAWWYGLAPDIEPPTLSGDFDNDNDVDGVDFLAWQGGFGGTFDATDLADWESNFGTTGGAFAVASVVPEPSTCGLFLFSLAIVIGHRPQRRAWQRGRRCNKQKTAIYTIKTQNSGGAR